MNRSLQLTLACLGALALLVLALVLTAPSDGDANIGAGFLGTALLVTVVVASLRGIAEARRERQRGIWIGVVGLTVAVSWFLVFLVLPFDV